MNKKMFKMEKDRKKERKVQRMNEEIIVIVEEITSIWTTITRSKAIKNSNITIYGMQNNNKIPQPIK